MRTYQCHIRLLLWLYVSFNQHLETSEDTDRCKDCITWSCHTDPNIHLHTTCCIVITHAYRNPCATLSWTRWPLSVQQLTARGRSILIARWQNCRGQCRWRCGSLCSSPPRWLQRAPCCWEHWRQVIWSCLRGRVIFIMSTKSSLLINLTIRPSVWSALTLSILVPVSVWIAMDCSFTWNWPARFIVSEPVGWEGHSENLHGCVSCILKYQMIGDTYCLSIFYFACGGGHKNECTNHVNQGIL